MNRSTILLPFSLHSNFRKEQMRSILVTEKTEMPFDYEQQKQCENWRRIQNLYSHWNCYVLLQPYVNCYSKSKEAREIYRNFRIASVSSRNLSLIDCLAAPLSSLLYLISDASRWIHCAGRKRKGET